jgi:hypothetical protein
MNSLSTLTLALPASLTKFLVVYRYPEQQLAGGALLDVADAGEELLEQPALVVVAVFTVGADASSRPLLVGHVVLLFVLAAPVA